MQAALVNGCVLVGGDPGLAADVEQRADEATLGELHGVELFALWYVDGVAIWAHCCLGGCDARGVVLDELA